MLKEGRRSVLTEGGGGRLPSGGPFGMGLWRMNRYLSGSGKAHVNNLKGHFHPLKHNV